jgi:tRNA A-37 threonylcarbamoyl transferase component Bud32
LYFVNWQRYVQCGDYNGRKVVIKTNKNVKGFREFMLVFGYVMTSLVMLHPSSPHPLGSMLLHNEGPSMRHRLRKLGILTPELLYMSKKTIIEEYIEGGNLYSMFERKGDISFASQAGILTARLHKAGLVFLDNKSENYLVDGHNQLIRTDLGFIMKENSVFSRSMDIASFLASIMDLSNSDYRAIHGTFIKAYINETGKSCPYLYLVLRNIIALVLTSSQINTFTNMVMS